MMQKYGTSEKAAHVKLFQWRRTHPQRVKSTIRVPSQLIPDLVRWWAVYANHWCPVAQRVLLNREPVKICWNRLLRYINEGRIHDDMNVDEIHVQVCVTPSGFPEYLKFRAGPTSKQEGWHELENRVLGPNLSSVGGIIGTFVELSYINRTNIQAGVHNRGNFDFGVPTAGFFRLYVIQGIRDDIKSYPRWVFPEGSLQVRFISTGDVSVGKDTGERFGILWLSSLYDDLRAFASKACELVDSIQELAAEEMPDSMDGAVAAESSKSSLPHAHIQALLAVVSPDFTSYMKGLLQSAECEVALQRSKTAEVPGEPSMLNLFSAAEYCFGRELNGIEKGRIRLKYASMSPPDPSADGSLISVEILHDNWMEFLKVSSLGANQDLFEYLRTDGMSSTQRQLQASIQGVHEAALKGISTDLQHTLLVRAWLCLPQRGIPGKGTLHKAYEREVDAEVAHQAHAGQIADAASFKATL